ncbi:hypothetical protein IW261DRAFT_1686568 [Armillaria novae-zelandiae]|uniref:C2H2-type domain-containing protein n=1 Tax=Armillaria novae-zelandiae TaxID=153914 RepID=A0AA39T4W5_9AGAR|nr:hypothetical protein IW261DRAFT_1686568 [Armillaria novae-zelandiae]
METSVPKPFICGKCMMAFGCGPELERHKKTHLVGEERAAVSFKCPYHPSCMVQSLQKSNVVGHIHKLHPELRKLICHRCRRSLFVAEDIYQLLQHEQDVHSILHSPLESPPSLLPMSSPSAVYSSTSILVTSHSSSTEQHITPGSSSTDGIFISSSSPMSSLPDELRGLLLHGGPQEFQLAEIASSSPFTWHPSHTVDVPPLSTVYDMLPQAFYAGRPDLYSPPPSLYGGSTNFSQGPSVAGISLTQSIPVPPPALPTPPPSRPSTASPSSQPH